ncbi:DUF4920 domain-containing protein [Algoriphagus sp. D3-2-R+10]|uniref:DUF4920 domain-containing protein n=1 Tax=Algoriphagus aurantiacus TaxID=3103948 RepID=UPI002B3B2E00|nr:DUF4920 domain-containing protein [Algoriphagus sp. D3-2-R+10]MEB2775277.1 DUF4920 domain-containing protein [Algoriphagus sp. D3-2-R+10]
MKIPHLVVLAFGIALSTACQNQKSETVIEGAETEVDAADTIPGNYGADLEVAGVVSPAEMILVVEKEGDFEGKISGEIKEVCTKKGCWLTMDLPNGESMRVTFKDYGFFVPTTSQGYPIILEGVAVLTETDVKTLRHYAEDEGMSKEEVDAITEPKREITFEAVGVVIKDKA